MMFFLAVIGLILLELIIQPLIHLVGGHVLFLPIFILIAGAYGRWYEWGIYIASLAFVSFFISFSPLFFLMLLAGSFGLAYIFDQWVNETWFRFGIVSVVLILIITIPFLFYEHHLSFPIFGSIILNVFILGILFLSERKQI